MYNVFSRGQATKKFALKHSTKMHNNRTEGSRKAQHHTINCQHTAHHMPKNVFGTI